MVPANRRGYKNGTGRTITQELLPAAVIGWAATEQEAIARLTQLQDQWEVALVDLFLLQGSGLGVVRAMKHRAPNQLLFVLSNYATQDMRQRSLHDGANAVFDKSTELDALLDRLEAAPAP